jgi:drug/metabolite transporter (DMT)-like permease
MSPGRTRSAWLAAGPGKTSSCTRMTFASCIIELEKDLRTWTGRRYGIALVALSAVLWSTAGLFVRLAHLDIWTLVAWRSVFSALTLGIYVLVRNRRRIGATLASIGYPGLVAVPISVISSISYVVALKLTTVANVMTIYAALPFITAAIAFVWHGERVTRRFTIACGFTLLGIVIMTGASADPRDLAGIAAAFVMTAGFAAQLVHAKRHPGVNMTVVSALAAATCALVAFPFMQVDIPAPLQLLTCALFGVFTTGIGYVLVLQGGRYIGSGEAAFISLLDVILGPLWVWFIFAETPGLVVLLGSFIVLSAVAWYLLHGLCATASHDAA